MSKDKYPCIFSREMETIVYIFSRQMEAIVYIWMVLHRLVLTQRQRTTHMPICVSEHPNPKALYKSLFTKLFGLSDVIHFFLINIFNTSHDLLSCQPQ